MKKEAQFLIKLLEKFDKQKVFLEQRRLNEKWSLIIYVRCTTSRNSTSSWLNQIPYDYTVEMEIDLRD